jgi:hypothetical protein
MRGRQLSASRIFSARSAHLVIPYVEHKSLQDNVFGAGGGSATTDSGLLPPRP